MKKNKTLKSLFKAYKELHSSDEDKTTLIMIIIKKNINNQDENILIVGGRQCNLNCSN
jgi:NADPH-dependent 7-cyano-7-deazaguanine reductase QueF